MLSTVKVGLFRVHHRESEDMVQYSWPSLVAQLVKNPSAMRET